MKYIKIKPLLLTSVVCLLAIIPGIILWDKLPSQMAIHFDINNNADNFASKGFVVFGLPILMVALQIFCCFINDINSHKHGERIKFERATKWIIPVMTILLQGVTYGYNLGYSIDIRAVVSIIVSGIFILIGNYMPKFDYIKNYDIDTQKARKINRFIGYESVIMGLLFLISAFLPPIYTLICLILMIPYAVISIVYSVLTIKK